MNTKRILILTTAASLAAVLAYGIFSFPAPSSTPSQSVAAQTATPVPETTVASTASAAQVNEPMIQYVDLPTPTTAIQIAQYDRDGDEEKVDGHESEQSHD